MKCMKSNEVLNLGDTSDQSQLMVTATTNKQQRSVIKKMLCH